MWLPGSTFWVEVEPPVTRAILYGNLQEKCRTRMLGTAFCVEIVGKIPMDMSQEPFTGKMREATFGARTLCGNLQEKTRMDIAQGPFCVEIYRKNAGRARPHLDLHGPLFTLTVRTPSVWPHCLGKKSVSTRQTHHPYEGVQTETRPSKRRTRHPFEGVQTESEPSRRRTRDKCRGQVWETSVGDK